MNFPWDSEQAGSAKKKRAFELKESHEYAAPDLAVRGQKNAPIRRFDIGAFSQRICNGALFVFNNAPIGPDLNQVDDEQRQKRDNQGNDGDDRRGDEIVLFRFFVNNV